MIFYKTFFVKEICCWCFSVFRSCSILYIIIEYRGKGLHLQNWVLNDKYSQFSINDNKGSRSTSFIGHNFFNWVALKIPWTWSKVHLPCCLLGLCVILLASLSSFPPWNSRLSMEAIRLLCHPVSHRILHCSEYCHQLITSVRSLDSQDNAPKPWICFLHGDLN